MELIKKFAEEFIYRYNDRNQCIYECHNDLKYGHTSETYYTYNNEGVLLYSICENDMTVYQYNELGKLSRTWTHDIFKHHKYDGLTFETDYKYDGDNIIEKKTKRFKIDTKKSHKHSTETYEYDDQNRLKNYSLSYDDVDEYYGNEYVYDKNGNMILEYKIHNFNLDKYHHKYNDRGQLIEVYSQNEKRIYKKEFTYNIDGLLINESFSYHDTYHCSDNTGGFDYEYDDKRNCIRKARYNEYFENDKRLKNYK